MEQFLLYFGVDQNLIGNVGQCALFVDIPHEPILSDECVNRTKWDHVLSLKVPPAAYTFFICFFVSHLGEVLDKRDEYILWVVFLEFYLGLGGLAAVLLQGRRVMVGTGEFDFLGLVNNATLFLCRHVNLNYYSCEMLVSAFVRLHGQGREKIRDRENKRDFCWGWVGNKWLK